MSKTVVGLFDDFSHAQMVVSELEAAGFRREEISMVTHQNGISHGTSTHSAGTDEGHGVVGGAVGGAAKGGVIGGLTGLAASLVMLAIPGVGPALAVGPLAATLSGAGLGAAGGGIIGGLTGLGIPHNEAGYYAEGIRRGSTLVSVNTDDARSDEAMAIFNRHNPVDIDERSSHYTSTGYTGYNEDAPHYTPEQITAERNNYATARTTPAMGTTAAAGTINTETVNTGSTTAATGTNEVAIPIVEEQIAVGKREVTRGGARIHTYVTERPVEENVTLREEHVNVERHAVNRPASEADLNAFKDGTFEVTERAEEAVVAKQARVVEEVVVNKEATERTETIRDTVRRTDVDVDELDDDDVTTTTHNTTTTGTGRI
ncbi:MAG: YsnF/AvaK domain-containing protein [Armatimonadota bacterium]